MREPLRFTLSGTGMPVSLVYVPAERGLTWRKHVLPALRRAALDLGWEKSREEHFPYVFGWDSSDASFDTAKERGHLPVVEIRLGGYVITQPKEQP